MKPKKSTGRAKKSAVKANFELVKIRFFNESGKAWETVIFPLEYIIKNPRGFHASDLGVAFLNLERAKRGLPLVERVP